MDGMDGMDGMELMVCMGWTGEGEVTGRVNK